MISVRMIMARTAIPAVALAMLAGCNSDTYGDLSESESQQTMNEDVQTYEPMANNAVNREENPSAEDTVTPAYTGQTEYQTDNSRQMTGNSGDSLASTQYQAVSFAPNSTELSPAAKEALSAIVGNLRVDSPVALTMQAADPDNPGASAGGDKAQARAETVEKYIEQQGVVLQRVTFLDDSPAQPVADPKEGEVQQLFLFLVEQNDRVSSN